MRIFYHFLFGIEVFCQRNCWNPRTGRYLGLVSITKSGRSCQNWSTNYPHFIDPAKRPRNGALTNYCRNPDRDPRGPWCFTNDPDLKYEYCEVRKCRLPSNARHERYNRGPLPKEPCECFSRLRPYKGTQSTTQSGTTCQNWLTDFPHRRNFNLREPNANHNYCRNPDHDSKGPWCYTTDPNKRYEYCGIPKCNSELMRNCDKTVQTKLITTTQKPIYSTRQSEEIPENQECKAEVTKNHHCGIVESALAFTESEEATCLNKTLQKTPCLSPIISGENTTKNVSWPWQVKVLGIGCGGTLISLRTVITAAHCFENDYVVPRSISVTVGHLIKDDYSARKEPGYQIRRLEKILKHPNFGNPKKYDNDITLLITETPFDYSANVRPACLPGSAAYKCRLRHGTKCIITGFGETRKSNYNSQLILQHTTVPIVGPDECKRNLGEHIFTKEKMICAGGDGHDTCQGDSGGPLVCKVLSHYAIFGVTSWGYDCGVKNQPGVYTDIITYLPWIHQNKVD